MKMAAKVMSPGDIGIILTYRCRSACRHCLYCCGPRWEKEGMSASDVREALNAVTLFPRLPRVHLTGGEPFLHFDLLLEGASIASRLGIEAYVETSAIWCTDEGETRRLLVELREAGLESVLVSCSPFHAERIPPERTFRAVRAALDIFGPRRTIVYLPEYLRILGMLEQDRGTPLSRYEEIFGREKARIILWQGYGVISGGRSGYHLGQFVERHPASAFAGDTCAADILHAHHSHFDLYGNYISGFCGGLSLGSWRSLPLLFEDFWAGRFPSLVKILIESGPNGLFDLARRRYGYEDRPGGYAGKCHLCVDVRRHLARSGEFEELRPPGFYENLAADAR